MAKPLAIVTGGSNGIGLVFARKLAVDHDLLIIARNKNRLEDAASMLRKDGGNSVDVLSADLSVMREIEIVANRVRSAENLSLLVNNAGFGSGSYFWESDLGPLTKMHHLHVMATLHLTHAALQNMVPRGKGAVIQVSSMGALMARAGSSSYRATKAWMVAFAEGLSLELQCAQSPVSMQVLCPGFTFSDFHERRGVDMRTLARPSFWHAPEFVVNTSLRELGRGKVLVVPGWRNRLIGSVMPRLPLKMRSKVQRTDSWLHRFAPGLTYSAVRSMPPDQKL
jgi:uncharacterized protein